ncbi:damage-inducible protein DinB [Sulfitobacter sp. JL08]|uniref:DinB family protein n=1 Tax=Sulfitobacter sp. JL08 TaxID=2070369 RepID=UPI000E0C7104|nr:DinB family protein [Sulfitobacter sp. JL08]AXI54930.1 damage-inducible protein DinB [Sulfitobacter sp. JL08]
MIDRGYCVTMARYNAWQNTQMTDTLKALDEKALHQDRGAFFGSIMATLNHLVWGDHLWISRFDGGDRPAVGPKEGLVQHPTFASWSAARFKTDGRILQWAQMLNNIDLKGDLTWFSGAVGKELTKPKEICVMQLFNHQTHHRGQIHAMMTAAGLKTSDTDLPFMPEPE